MFSRRDFLTNMSATALVASAVNPLLSWATDAQIAIPGKEDLIVRSYRFYDLETPVEYFRTWLTRADHFFVRNHMHEPSTIDPAQWKLSIGGEVEKFPHLAHMRRQWRGHLQRAAGRVRDRQATGVQMQPVGGGEPG